MAMVTRPVQGGAYSGPRSEPGGQPTPRAGRTVAAYGVVGPMSVGHLHSRLIKAIFGMRVLILWLRLSRRVVAVSKIIKFPMLDPALSRPVVPALRIIRLLMRDLVLSQPAVRESIAG
jgi:hypothetical protein